MKYLKCKEFELKAARFPELVKSAKRYFLLPAAHYGRLVRRSGKTWASIDFDMNVHEKHLQLSAESVNSIHRVIDLIARSRLLLLLPSQRCLCFFSSSCVPQ